MNNMSLDDQLKLVKAKWTSPDKYERSIKVTNHGLGHYSIGFNKTLEQVLQELNEDEKKEYKWWQIWK